MKKGLLAASAFALAMFSTQASAVIYTYDQSNGAKLTIDTDAGSGSIKGADIDATFASADLTNFTGGAKPSFTAVLSSLDGTRLIGGQWITDNPKDSTTTHPQKLIFSSSNVNLWAWWGNPIVGGDYVTGYKTYTSTSSSGGTPVPAPGMAGLFGLGVLGLLFARRRRKNPGTSLVTQPAFA